MTSVIDRFLKYVRIDTRSVQPTPGAEQIHPSSPNQRVLANQLKEELQAIGVPNDWFVPLDDGSFLVQFPATEGHESAPHIVFAAHVDTYFGCPGGADGSYAI